MKRRAFITLLGGAAAAASPLATHAQQGERVRRIGVLSGFDKSDPEGGARFQAFDQALAALGWSNGRNVVIMYRWSDVDPARTRAAAAELVAFKPDVLLSSNTPTTQALAKATQTIPIVFVSLTDPVGTGIISNLARPEGNTTGFMSYEYSMAGKWVGLMRDVAPRVTRAAIMFNPKTAAFAPNYLRPAEDAARSFGIKLSAAAVQSEAEIAHTIAALAEGADGGLVVLPDVSMLVHREAIVALTARHRVPAVYGIQVFARSGGLLTYGPDTYDQFRQGASYVDRILRGAKPADLPVQVPTKFSLVVNLKTARALGLTISEAFLLTADEVIE